MTRKDLTNNSFLSKKMMGLSKFASQLLEEMEKYKCARHINCMSC